MKAAVTEKLLRSLLAKDEPQTIWDQIPPNLEWRIGKQRLPAPLLGGHAAAAFGNRFGCLPDASR